MIKITDLEMSESIGNQLAIALILMFAAAALAAAAVRNPAVVAWYVAGAVLLGLCSLGLVVLAASDRVVHHILKQKDLV
ncbi:MAG: hypothetical protein Q7R67_02550 [bacterium]|nr:hypothetical protein [bacterium]